MQKDAFLDAFPNEQKTTAHYTDLCSLELDGIVLVKQISSSHRRRFP